jgi:hypothetical protein
MGPNLEHIINFAEVKDVKIIGNRLTKQAGPKLTLLMLFENFSGITF